MDHKSVIIMYSCCKQRLSIDLWTRLSSTQKWSRLLVICPSVTWLFLSEIWLTDTALWQVPSFFFFGRASSFWFFTTGCFTGGPVKLIIWICKDSIWRVRLQCHGYVRVQKFVRLTFMSSLGKSWHIPPLANYSVCKWANVTPRKSDGLHLKWCVIDDSPHDTFVRCKINTFFISRQKVRCTDRQQPKTCGPPLIPEIELRCAAASLGPRGAEV